MKSEQSKHSESCRYYKAGDWELYVFFTNRGTKSEGQFGVLLQNGSKYPPAVSSESEEIETELGKMKYYGLEMKFDALDSRVPWAPTGWLFADASKIPHSRT
jgi:hypothetical protein